MFFISDNSFFESSCHHIPFGLCKAKAVLQFSSVHFDFIVSSEFGMIAFRSCQRNLDLFKAASQNECDYFDYAWCKYPMTDKARSKMKKASWDWQNQQSVNVKILSVDWDFWASRQTQAGRRESDEFSSWNWMSIRTQAYHDTHIFCAKWSRPSPK